MKLLDKMIAPLDKALERFDPLKQAEKEYENAQKQVTALEEEAVKALTGESQLIVSRLIERVDVSTGYKVHIKFKISLKQFLGQEVS